MREILFRGKNEYGVWVYGMYIPYQNGEAAILYEKFSAYGYEAIELCQRSKVIPETVGQFTGFNDKNGKKIFEGDYWIDTDENDIFVVEFRNGQYCFVIYGACGVLMEYGYDETAGGFGECDCVPMTDYYIEEMEIIGNIHDNPELISGGSNAD